MFGFWELGHGLALLWTRHVGPEDFSIPVVGFAWCLVAALKGN
jgi:hypothetical protein